MANRKVQLYKYIKSVLWKKDKCALADPASSVNGFWEGNGAR
jgi:hypothetical protein